MTIARETKAARSLIAWLDARKIDFPWSFRTFSNGHPYLRLAVPPPYVAMVVPTKKVYMLLMSSGSSADPVNGLPIGNWRADPEFVFVAMLNIMLLGAKEYRDQGRSEQAYAFAASVMACASEIGDKELVITALVQVVAPHHRVTGDVEGAHKLLASIREQCLELGSSVLLAALDEELRITEEMLDLD